ncbi:hypothetical protein GCM10022225_40050 [Plantactinospora mayteni]|uniref:Uncharacterized protein n=1 Tax=Plantactinospora mayteni TaxID=566021 RepID=A0ABQ4ETT7_9ACTN|nr:hypothetical protein [Plantactinospora mayteni]GIG98029.1 hypothetical protein Pma05_46020 [Plantactinospora mayteni]
MAVSGRPDNRSFLVPMVALGSTLVALVVATVLVLVLRDGGPVDPTGTGPSTGGTPTPGNIPSGAPVAAGCLAGTWRVTSHREQVDVPEVGRLSFTGGIGSTLSLSAEGVGIVDYGSGTVFASSHAGQEVVLELRGRVDYRYTLAGDRIELRDVRSAAEVRLRVGAGTPGRWRPFTASTAPSSHTCAGDKLTLESLASTTLYARSE